MTSLKVPLAYDEARNLVSIEAAERGKAYFCPSCNTPLIFKHGAVKVRHFAHQPSEVCNQETITHKVAKLCIQQAVLDWKAGKARIPIVERACQICDEPIKLPIPSEIDNALLEHRLSDGSVADVALMINGSPIIAIEIRVSHAVDEIKAQRLTIPFIELDGIDVLENPATWLPIEDSLEPLLCNSCLSDYQQFETRMKLISAYTKVQLPESYYRYAPYHCWKCHKDMLVFSWPDIMMWNPEKPSKIPIPRTVRKGDYPYWGNFCPHCDSLQGDNYVHMRLESPFSPVNCEGDDPVSFKSDLMQIAHWVKDFELHPETMKFAIAARLWLLLHDWQPPYEWWMETTPERIVPATAYTFLTQQGWQWDAEKRYWFSPETGEIEDRTDLPDASTD